MTETKIKRFKWLFVLKGGRYTNGEKIFDYSTGKHFIEPKLGNNTITFIGTDEEIDNFYNNLIDEGYSVQDDYNLGEYEKENS